MVEITIIQLHFMYIIILLSSISIDIRSVHSSSNVSCLSGEREALVMFKKGLTDPSNRLSSWVGKNCCTWVGITCDANTRHVIALELQNPYAYKLDRKSYALGGEINNSLVNLKSLKYLDLSMNNFKGINIPSFIGSLKNLRYLNLSGSNFDGIIPTQVCNLSKLESLDLSGFSYESDANDLNFLPSLVSLKYLSLGYVNLSLATNNWLEMINKLTFLEELHLPACGLFNLPLSLSDVNFTSLSRLDLSSNGFNSNIPKWLFNLTSLRYLDMSSNSLSGNMPNEFSNLISIQHIDMSRNTYIDGKLPKDLGKLCRLRNLWLTDNHIKGELTEFFDGLLKCSNSSFEHLDLGFNEMFGFIPSSVGLIKNFKHIYLRFNSFTGSIPKSIVNLTLLHDFDLSDNKMNGIIPESLGQLYSLSVLDIFENNWLSVITEAHLFNLTSLTELSISTSLSSTLSFNVSPEWVPPFKLSSLSLKYCQIGPKFPFWLRNQNKLNSISLRSTMISDVVPDWFWNLDLLIEVLDLSNNDLSGRVPSSFTFQDQSWVDLSSNGFTGPLPNFTANLETLFLRNNSFYGPIPEDIDKMLPTLTNYDVSQNFLNGTLPVSLGKIQSLTILEVSSNHLTGEIPLIWDDKPNLLTVGLSNNRFSGKIPSSMGSLSSLMSLSIGNNNLSGEIPSSMGSLSSLKFLNIENNNLSGKIPSSMGSLSSLMFLNIENNNLSGKIPTSMGSLSSLEYLSIGNNNLSGEIPPSLQNCTLMFNLDLGENNFWGNIPSWVGEKMPNLRILRLRKNSFSGHVPSQLCTLTNLHILDLAQNSLSGQIPSCLGGLKRMSLYLLEPDSTLAKLSVVMKGKEFEYQRLLYLVNSIDLSGNNLSGKIPTKMTELSRLGTLNLSMNHLTGEIPEDIGKLKMLETLDLSKNKLSGSIPSSVVSMYALSHLNLSYNNFSGRIPTSNQFLTLDDPSIYGGNVGLCGVPLVTECHAHNDVRDDEEEDGSGNNDNLWFYASIVMGVIVGLGGFCGSLFVNRSWRNFYFGYVEKMIEKIARVFGMKVDNKRRK